VDWLLCEKSISALLFMEQQERWKAGAVKIDLIVLAK
jgi:hypothetical protein